MKARITICLLACLPLALVGCSGGGGGGEGGSPAPGATATTMAKAVQGPLDTVQATVSSAVFDPLASATGGTGLSGTVKCANVIVNGNLLNTVDALANGVSDPANLQTKTAAEVQMQLAKLVGNLQVLIGSLASQGGGCSFDGSGSVNSGDLSNITNALAGTPLAPLANLLPQLGNLQSLLTFGGQMNLPSLGSVVTQLKTALSSALSQLPSQVTDAPIIGGLLTALPPSLDDIANLLNTVQSNPQAAPAALATTVQNLLATITTQIVPLADLQQLAGTSGTASPVSQIVANLQNLGSVLQGQLANATPGSGPLPALGLNLLDPVLQPVQALLGQLTPQLTSALQGVQGTPTDPVGGLLNNVLPVVQNVLGGLVGQLPGGGTSGSSCPLATLPLLSILCP